jgi:signal transduction histidine kinase
MEREGLSMKIRSKLILYFGILLVVSFSIAGLLTAYFIHSASNRLLFSSVAKMNDNIAASITSGSLAYIVEDMESIKNVIGVESILFRDGELAASTFAGETPDVTTAMLASEKYDVWGLRTGTTFYYFTAEELGNGYRLYIFRSEDIAAFEGDGIIFAAFVGVAFLVFSISAISVYAARVFVEPIRDLAGYANRMKPDQEPESRPVFSIDEFNELGSALEKAAIRLADYRESEREFLHNFSHEMKTPLTNIYGYAEGVYCGVLKGEEAEGACKVIMTESEKLKDNINQILLLGRLDAVEDAYKMAKTSIADVVADAMNAVQIAAQTAGVTLQCDPPAASLYLLADADKLEAAITNVLSNGIRYAKTVVVVNVVDDDDWMVITVDDDGPGIPEADRERVFDRYFIGTQGHTGLGLTISRSIVNAHGGSIIAMESPQGGARFVFRLPRKNA